MQVSDDCSLQKLSTDRDMTGIGLAARKKTPKKPKNNNKKKANNNNKKTNQKPKNKPQNPNRSA